MLSYGEVITMATALDEDVIVSERNYKNGLPMIELMFNDFEDFDENWNEKYRDYNNEQGVDKLIDLIKQYGELISNSLYEYYQFNSFVVEISFSSFDI